MKGFNFEKNLNHQSHAVDSTIGVFQDISLIQPTEADKNYINPVFDFQLDWTYPENIRKVRERNGGITESIKRNSNIIDIMMETGQARPILTQKLFLNLTNNMAFSNLLLLCQRFLSKREQ
jgi:type III restriction enzyme